jgi:shikimate dehydrogenase
MTSEARVRVRGAAPSGQTLVAGVIGDPVRHSLSPALHNAAYRALGLDWVYVAFEVAAPDFAAAVEGARSLGLVGLSVTMPHKEAAAKLSTRRSTTVRRLGAANTLTFVGREIVAASTDGQGFIADMRQSLSFDPEGRRCGVIGAGGAARSVVAALADAGASEILVVNRTPARGYRAASLAPGRGKVAKPEDLDKADLIVNATPVGMRSRPGGPAELDADPEPPLVGASRFGSGQVVVDLVYDPLVTPWRTQAAENGARTANGLGMLVHQAALQVEIWSGTRPPLDEMWRAVRLGIPPGLA